ncbi:hypothetical protein KY311_00830 [Candidatus Woesearchaeota archaeon]|nr:hypothetical protein [Candidatus Woesearchaeota archaeon]
MNIAEKAFSELFPGKLVPEISIKYSGRFSPYNANVKRTPWKLEFSLSKEWRKIDEQIKIGLLQSLLCKIYRHKARTTSIDLYNSFTKHIHIAIPKTKSDPVLNESFERVNEKYFKGMIEVPNLVWGAASKTTLGHYSYHSDRISISSVFKGGPEVFIDYVMYHEILHKKIKFHSKNGKNYHHTTEFRKKEKEFENSKVVELELRKYLRGKSIHRQRKQKRGFFGWFS